MKAIDNAKYVEHEPPALFNVSLNLTEHLRQESVENDTVDIRTPRSLSYREYQNEKTQSLGRKVPLVRDDYTDISRNPNEKQKTLLHSTGSPRKEHGHEQTKQHLIEDRREPDKQSSCSIYNRGPSPAGRAASTHSYSPIHSRTCSPTHFSSYTSGIPHTSCSLNSSLTSEAAAVCRICHGDGRREQLLSPCYCAGSIGMLHLSCLQRRLGSSNKTHCELCNFQFTMERKPKPLHMFLRNPGTNSDKRHIICDIVCFSILTPLTIAAVWFCMHGALNYDTKKLESVGLSTLGAALLLLYIIWVVICLKHNIKLWKDWQQFNQDVRLKCLPPTEGPRLGPIPEDAESSTMPSKGARRGTVKLCSIEIRVTTGGDTSHPVTVQTKDTSKAGSRTSGYHGDNVKHKVKSPSNSYSNKSKDRVGSASSSYANKIKDKFSSGSGSVYGGIQPLYKISSGSSSVCGGIQPPLPSESSDSSIKQTLQGQITASRGNRIVSKETYV